MKALPGSHLVHLDSPLSLAPLVTPDKNTIYTLSVVTRDGCTIDKFMQILVIKDFLLPNAFSPNYDGVNDFFSIPFGSLDQLSSFSIFDRWGNRLFCTNDPAVGWDGTICILHFGSENLHFGNTKSPVFSPKNSATFHFHLLALPVILALQPILPGLGTILKKAWNCQFK